MDRLPYPLPQASSDFQQLPRHHQVKRSQESSKGALHALWNAGLEDRQFLTARIAVCEEGLRRFPAADELMTENRRRALAESHFELGESDTAEALYRDWLQADPRWGWGWIGWSDGYGFLRKVRDWP